MRSPPNKLVMVAPFRWKPAGVMVASTLLAVATGIAAEPADAGRYLAKNLPFEQALRLLSTDLVAEELRLTAEQRLSMPRLDREIQKVVFNRPAPAPGPSTYFPSATPMFPTSPAAGVINPTSP